MKTGHMLAVLVSCACLMGQAGDVAWTGAVDQNWNEIGNWSGGVVPGVTDSALLTNSTASFVVKVTTAPASPVGDLTVSNVNALNDSTELTITNAFFGVDSGPISIGKNAALNIQNGGVMSYQGDAAGNPFFTVSDGGTINIGSGGGLLLTNLSSGASGTYQSFYLGYESEGSMFIGDGGSFVMGPPSTGATNIQFRMGYQTGGNGLLEMTGNSTFSMPRYYKGISFYVGRERGLGTINLSGQAACLISNKVQIGTYAGTGVVTLADNSVLRLDGQVGGQSVGYGSGGYGVITIKDNAFLDVTGSNDQQFSLGSGGGMGALNVYGGKALIRNFFNTGYGGTAVINITNGYVEAMGQYDRGLTVGLATSASSPGKSELNLSNGALVSKGKAGTYLFGANSGISIGKTAASNCCAYGALRMESGIVTNLGPLFVGMGLGGTGVVIQTGGVFSQVDANERVFIGCGGGNGSYTMSNGTFATRQDVYVGGMSESDYPDEQFDWNRKAYLYKFNPSVGVLRIDGGTFTVDNADLSIAGKGAGALVLGADAVCSARNIMIDTNTNSTVRFEFGAQSAGALQATNLLTICDGAKLEVDSSAYEGSASWIKLIDCVTRDGAFATEDITVTGHGTVCQDRDEDIWLNVIRGTLVIIL